ncbi:hypothetical protein CaCOL14_010033 [Colletotrichum acutatum]
MHFAEATKKPVLGPQSSPIKTGEKKHDQGSSPNQHLRGFSSRIEELRFDMSISDVTETSDSLSDYSPPPSPPRPIHQGGDLTTEFLARTGGEGERLIHESGFPWQEYGTGFGPCEVS